MRKSLWSPDEDAKLKQYVTKHGYGNWSDVAKHAGLQRCGKSCRLRWLNYLRPDLKRGKFSADEIRLIVKLHKSLGNSWSKIASFLPGRTDNDIKNFWHSYTRSTRKVDQQPTRDHSTSINGSTSSINGTTSSITVATNSSALPRCDNYTDEITAAHEPSPSGQMMQLITATSSNSCGSYSPTATDKITDSPISSGTSTTGQMMNIGCTNSTHNPNLIPNVPAWELINSSSGAALTQPSMIKLVNGDTSSFDHNSRQLEPGLLKMLINCSTNTPAGLMNATYDPLSCDINPMQLNMQNMANYYPSAYADQYLHSFTWDEVEAVPAPEGLQSVVWSFMKATTKEDLSSSQELQAT